MPAKAKNRYAATKWGTEPTMELEVPSGQLCLVRRPGPTGLMKAGILDDIDFLGQIVAGEHIPRGEGQPPSQVKASVTEQMQELVQNKEGLVKAMDLMDKVLEYVVIEPRISRPVRRDDAGKPLLELNPKNGKQEEVPLPDEEKAPGVIYTDMVDLVDKSFIFQFVVGGTADLATFRKEHEEALGSLATVPAVPDEAI